MKILTQYLSIATLLLCVQTSVAQTQQPSQLQLSQQVSGGGFVVLAEHRFDPWVQRMIAEQSLKAMPLLDGRLYYFFPMQSNPYLEEMQIRYLEELLAKQKNDEPLGE